MSLMVCRIASLSMKVSPRLLAAELSDKLRGGQILLKRWPPEGIRQQGDPVEGGRS